MKVSHPLSTLAVPTPPSVRHGVSHQTTVSSGPFSAPHSAAKISKRRTRRVRNSLSSPKSAPTQNASSTSPTEIAPADAAQQEYRDCLQQAEICHAQAQEAARLKRFQAARGLFATAIALCQRALGLREKKAPADVPPVVDTLDTAAAEDARQVRAYLHELTIEMTTYSDLARSLERPLQPHPSNPETKP